MSTSIPSVDQGGGTVVPITGFYQPSFILPYQVTLFTQGFWSSIQLPTAQDVTRRVNIPSAVLCTGLTLTVFSTCLMMNVRRPAFVFGHRAFNDTGGYSDFVNAAATSLAGIRLASEPSSSGPNIKAQEVTFTWLEHPADYVPPKMDLFAEAKIPFGARPALFCRKDAEHEEMAFDLLRYRHAFKKFGVPSVTSRASLPPRPVGSRVLGNTSSVHSLSDSNSICRLGAQGGSSTCDQKTYNASPTVSVYFWEPSPPIRRCNTKAPISRWSTIGLSSLLFVLGLLLAWQFHVDLSACFNCDGKDSHTLEQHMPFYSLSLDSSQAIVPAVEHSASDCGLLSLVDSRDLLVQVGTLRNACHPEVNSSVELDIITACLDTMVRWKDQSLSSVLDAVNLLRDRFDVLLSTEVPYETIIASSQFFLRGIIFGVGIVVCLCLRFVVLTTTGRFGWRSLAGLIRKARGSKAPRKKRSEKKQTTSPYTSQDYFYSMEEPLCRPSDYAFVRFVETPVEQADGQAPAVSEFDKFTFWYTTGHVMPPPLPRGGATTRPSVTHHQAPKQKTQHRPASNVRTTTENNKIQIKSDVENHSIGDTEQLARPSSSQLAQHDKPKPKGKNHSRRKN